MDRCCPGNRILILPGTSPHAVDGNQQVLKKVLFNGSICRSGNAKRQRFYESPLKSEKWLTGCRANVALLKKMDSAELFTLWFLDFSGIAKKSP